MLIRGIEADVLPTIQRYGMGAIVWSPLAGGWLSGKWRKGKPAPDSTRSQRRPEAFDLSRPENQSKLEAADSLAVLAEENNMSLVEMAIAFTIRHPAVTSAIIGPRTMEQLNSQLGAASLTLDDKLLDKIDEIVPPGTNASPREQSWENPALYPENRRRSDEAVHVTAF
jgi:aryl-alcohol dehydrogenase-like predicted oxidoreductase